MDRRQKKTRDAIFKALRTLMEQKQYSAITVQEIIDEANIGRSTFSTICKENQVTICGIIATDGDGLFMAYFKGYLAQLFSRYTMLFPREVPEDFLIHHLAGSFAETVKWWVAQNMVLDPETVAHFYSSVINK